MCQYSYFLLLVLLPLSSCSVGDSFPSFQECQQTCRNQYDCPIYNFALKWTIEPCFSCRQNCIWDTVKIFKNNNWNIPQFYGKWPFQPLKIKIGNDLFQIQEPASTIFSLLNLLTVLIMLNKITMKIEEDDRMKNIWKYYCYIGIIIWMFSTIFHSRDFWLTELLDYFGAFGIVCYTFYVSIIFTIPWLQRNQDGLKINYFIAGCLIAFYSTRVLLFLTGIDYGLNMFYCIILSIITGIIYITWILKEIIQGKKRESLKYLGIIIGIGLISACFEILDFPPILWIIDAHSIFHALTIPTPLLLAKFAYEESEYEQGRRKMVIGKYV